MEDRRILVGGLFHGDTRKSLVSSTSTLVVGSFLLESSVVSQNRRPLKCPKNMYRVIENDRINNTVIVLVTVRTYVYSG